MPPERLQSRWRVLATIVTLALAACSNAPVAEDASAGGPLRVAVVFAIGGRNDDGFNAGAAAGAERAMRDGGVRVRFVDGVPDAEREATVDRIARDSTDLVIGVGFLMSDALTRVAKRYPDVRFAALDYAIPVDTMGRAILPPANLAGVVFREEEGAYLVGAAAGLATRTRVVGFVGGMSNPMIRRFEAGYDAGVRRVCPACRVVASYAGTTPAAFGDPARGRALATAQYVAGADVVFHAAGATGDGVFAASREGATADGARRLVIGVDVDQHRQAPGRTLTSMLKRMDVAVIDVVRRARAGTLQGGLRVYGLAEGGVGFVHDSSNTSLMDGGMRRRLEILRAGIAAGLIVVPTSR